VEPEAHPHVTDEMLAASARDPEHLELLRAVGAQSYMVVPLRARGRVLGTMVLLSTDSARRYGDDDLAAAEELASGCALAVDNARRFAEAREAERRKDEGLALLDAVFANAPVGLGFLDTQLRYVRLNRKLAEINGRAIDEHLGHRVDEVLAGELGVQVAHDCLSVIESGEPLLDLEVNGETVYPGRRQVSDQVLEQVSGGRAEYAKVLRSIGLTSTMIVPLRARGRILGAMLLGAAESDRRFTASDLALAEELGVRCALALDNARLYQE